MAVASSADRLRAPARTTLACLTLVLLLAAPEQAASAQTAPKPTAKQLKKELAELQKDSDKLIADYYESRVAGQKAERAEKAAREKLSAAQEVYDRQSTELRAMAIAKYIGGDPGTAGLLTSEGDPSALLARMALAQHMIDLQDARLSGYARVRDDRRQAEQDAAARTEELQASTEELEKRKKKAERQIEKIKDRIDLLYTAPGVRRPDGTWVPQLPAGTDNVTPRMRLVKELIQQRFQVPYGIGCYRAIQDGGEHPLGRACDFMLSRGGAFPSGAELKRGDEIAAWAIKNAKRLGIMYIIYRQRIWHTRTGGWRTMSDRGGTTANHYDHPHISVY
ncbi:coiled-coil domain-containing protein [Nonomuraea fuscirosea]|uniref:coiled-coil domain-containing protein n=1 Tax=Nonomuraea fuscirosea TaxID=1291556 RepID=UPI00342DE1F3